MIFHPFKKHFPKRIILREKITDMDHIAVDSRVEKRSAQAQPVDQFSGNGQVLSCLEMIFIQPSVMTVNAKVLSMQEMKKS